MTDKSENTKQTHQYRVKRLIYRASYTGMKETDLLLGQFAQRHLAQLSEPELDEFEALLDAGDPLILSWVREDSTPPPDLDGPVLALIKDFHVNR